VGDLYEHQGKMKQAIQHYELALLREIEKKQYLVDQQIGQQININDIDFNQQESLSKIYTETFVKLFKTKNASCDWSDYDQFVFHLKKIVIKQF